MGSEMCIRDSYETATTEWGWGFHTVRGIFDPGNLRFRPQDVGISGVLKDFFHRPVLCVVIRTQLDTRFFPVGVDEGGGVGRHTE